MESIKKVIIKELVIQKTQESLNKWKTFIKILDEYGAASLLDIDVREEAGFTLGERNCPLCRLFLIPRKIAALKNRIGLIKSDDKIIPCSGCPVFEIGYGCIGRMYDAEDTPKKEYIRNEESPYEMVLRSDTGVDLYKATLFMCYVLEKALDYIKSKE